MLGGDDGVPRGLQVDPRLPVIPVRALKNKGTEEFTAKQVEVAKLLESDPNMANFQGFYNELLARERLDLGEEVLVHGVATKPGKPVIIGRIDKKPVIGLPGYPLSKYMRRFLDQGLPVYFLIARQQDLLECIAPSSGQQLPQENPARGWKLFMSFPRASVISASV